MTLARKRFVRNRRFVAAILIAAIYKMDKMSVSELAKAAWKILRSVTASKRKMVDHSIWFRRMRHCYKCPVFVRETLSCGSPFVNADVGCFCFLPAKNSLPEARCWLNDLGLDGGWPKELEHGTQ